MADYIFLLNNDAVIEKDTLSKLVEAAENSQSSIFSPIIYNRDNKIWYASGEVKWTAMKAIHSTKILDDKNPYPAQYVSGCAMLIKKEVFKKIGLFSEDYFLYYEDADFCTRAKKNGFECAVVPGTKVTHFEKSESDLSNKIYWLVFSGLIFFEKNTLPPLRLLSNPYLYLRKIKNKIDGMNNKKYAEAVKKAYLDFKKWKKNQKYPS